MKSQNNFLFLFEKPPIKTGQSAFCNNWKIKSERFFLGEIITLIIINSFIFICIYSHAVTFRANFSLDYLDSEFICLKIKKQKNNVFFSGIK